MEYEHCYAKKSLNRERNFHLYSLTFYKKYIITSFNKSNG